MSNQVFTSFNYETIAEKILETKSSVFLAIPGVTKQIASALEAVSDRLKGWENIDIIIDSSPKVYYLGYGEYGAYKELENKGCKFRCEENLRIGILIVDDQTYVFNPISLNLESNIETSESINAIILEGQTSESIIKALSAERVGNIPEIGNREISEIEKKVIEKELEINPPQKPDLTRKINVLTSKFQFIDFSFKGSKLNSKRISLNSRELGIKDKDLKDRISGQFKVFEKMPEDYEKGLKGLQLRFNEVKKKYTRPIGRYGTIVWKCHINDLERELEYLKEDIDKFNKDIIGDIISKITSSKESLKKFISENYDVTATNPFDEVLIKNKKDAIVDDFVEKAFYEYTPEKLADNLQLSFDYFNISSQMASDNEFNKKIMEILDIDLDDLVMFESAYGVEDQIRSK